MTGLDLSWSICCTGKLADAFWALHWHKCVQCNTCVSTVSPTVVSACCLVCLMVIFLCPDTLLHGMSTVRLSRAQPRSSRVHSETSCSEYALHVMSNSISAFLSDTITECRILYFHNIPCWFVQANVCSISRQTVCSVQHYTGCLGCYCVMNDSWDLCNLFLTKTSEPCPIGLLSAC